jgi:hypothetical protein
VDALGTGYALVAAFLLGAADDGREAWVAEAARADDADTGRDRTPDNEAAVVAAAAARLL